MRIILLCVGLCLLVLGLAVGVLAVLSSNERLLRITEVYLAVSLALLAAREIFVRIDRYRKRKYRQH